VKIDVRRLEGPADFDETWALQRELAAKVTPRSGFLLLLEHAPVYTVGRNGDPRNLLDVGEVPVRRIDRGGDVTWHGPGQLVGYPLLDIRRIGVRRFVGALEASILGVLSGFGLEAARKEGCTGVWAPGGKIASIGLRVRRGVTTHGFALNVCNDLEPFRRIHPCGVPGEVVTTLSRELGRNVDIGSVADRFSLLMPDGVVD
jgi:lipoyl(octanoyl) transferase